MRLAVLLRGFLTLAWLGSPPAFYLLKLAYGDSVVITVHGFFGSNETVHVQNPATSERKLHFKALPQDGVKIPNAKNLTKAVQGSEISFQVKVFQSGTLFRREIERQVRPRTMHWMQVGESRQDAPQVVFI
jgi:hypothetical protein